MSAADKKLMELIQSETDTDVSAPVKALSAAIAKRGDVKAILFYGSGLWKEASEDTLYDFYVLVERFKDFDARFLHAVLGRALAPNVYYMELQDGDRVLRCKYAVMTVKQFERAARGRSLAPQIWARFAQPCRVVYSDGESTAQRVRTALKECVLTFYKAALALTPEGADAKEIWLSGLRATYAAELRSEQPERTRQIFESGADAFTQRSGLAQEILTGVKRDSRAARMMSVMKRPLQKLVAFIRLMKASLTFDGAVDYALWKIERQSGVRAEASDFQRRYPLLGAWPLVWRLWRKGAFR